MCVDNITDPQRALDAADVEHEASANLDVHHATVIFQHTHLVSQLYYHFNEMQLKL